MSLEICFCLHLTRINILKFLINSSVLAGCFVLFFQPPPRHKALWATVESACSGGYRLPLLIGKRAAAVTFKQCKCTESFLVPKLVLCSAYCKAASRMWPFSKNVYNTRGLHPLFYSFFCFKWLKIICYFYEPKDIKLGKDLKGLVT